MANFYYVKTGGTAAGATDNGRVATTRSTGTFAAKGAASYYPDILTALTASTAPTDGDFIYCSSAHNTAHTTAQTLTIPHGVSVVSVDDTALDSYLAGAREVVDNGGSTLDISVNVTAGGTSAHHGMTYGAEDRMTMGSNDSVTVKYYNCTFEVFGLATAPLFSLISTGGSHYFQDCVWNWDVDVSAGMFNVGNGGNLTFINASATGTAQTGNLITVATDGVRVNIHSTDLTGFMAANCELVWRKLVGTGMIDMNLTGCLLPTGFDFFKTAPTTIGAWKFSMSECGTADEYYSYTEEETFNVVIEDLTQYLTATYDGSVGFSTKVTTGAYTSLLNPYRHEIATLPARDLSGAGGETYEMEIVSADSGLTDTDVWIEVEYQDNTNQALTVVESSRNADPIAAGTALTSSSAVWNVTTNTEYKISQAVTQKAAVANSNVRVYLVVSKPSITINADPAITIT